MTSQLALAPSCPDIFGNSGQFLLQSVTKRLHLLFLCLFEKIYYNV